MNSLLNADYRMHAHSTLHQNHELFKIPLPCLQALATEDRPGLSSVLHWPFCPILSRDLGLAEAVYILAAQASISMTNYLSEHSLRLSVPCEPGSTLSSFLQEKKQRACKLTSNVSSWICFLFQVSILPIDSTKHNSALINQTLPYSPHLTRTIKQGQSNQCRAPGVKF